MTKLKIPFYVFLCLLTPLGVGAQDSTINGGLQVTAYQAGAVAVIPNAKVTVVNLETGYKRDCLTGAGGQCKIPVLPPGYYRISAEADGFAQVPNAALDNYAVPHGPVTVLYPPPIELRGLAQAPPATTAPAAAPVNTAPTTLAAGASTTLLNAENATRSARFDERILLSLPLSGARTFYQVALLAPGVAPAPQAIGDTVGPGVGPGVGTSGQFAVNGLRSRANNFTVDGSDNNDEDIGVRRQGFTALVPQPIESVKGFRIVTLLPLPQRGRNLGAQTDAVSRGGGQQVHGTLFGFYTDRHLKARDAFDLTDPRAEVLRRASGQPVVVLDQNSRPIAPDQRCRGSVAGQLCLPDQIGGENPYTRGQYGFVVGGPVTKQKTFFFGSYERRDINAGKESNFAVPTVAERGLFRSGETGLQVRAGNQTSEAFPTSVIGDAYFSLFPFPNNPRGPYGANTYTEVLPASANGNIASFKLDRELSLAGKDHTLTGRYNFTDDATTLPVTGEALFSSLRALVRAQNLSLFFNSTFSPRLANEARFSYGRTRLNFDEVRNPFLLSSSLRNVPFLLNARRFSNATLPSDSETIYLLGGTTEEATDPIGQLIVSGYSPVGVDVFNFPQRRVNNTFQTADTVFYYLTNHTLVGGVDFRRTQLNSQLERNFRSVAYFSGSLDVAQQLKNQVANATPFLLGTDFLAAGAATGFFQTQAIVPDATIGLRQWQADLFLQDQYSASPKLRLTWGLRYQLSTVPEEVNRRIEQTFTSSEVQRFIAEEKRQFSRSGFEQYLAGRTRLYNYDRNNVAPHLAFAWSPFNDNKTAVRGGYGIYYDQIPGAVISQSRSVFPRFLTVNLAGVQPGNEIIAFNPVRLSQPGTLNTFAPRGPNALGARDLLEYLLALNQLSGTRAAGPGFVLPVTDLVTPYAQHWGLTVEREWSASLLTSLAYVGTKGTHLLRLATPNLGGNGVPRVDRLALIGDNLVFQGAVLSPGRQFQRPAPLLGSFTSIESDANSLYHSLQAEAQMRPTHGLQFTAAYTWSHAIDEASDLFDLAGSRALPQNSFNRRGERGDANFDVRHRLAQSFIWDLPFLRANRLLGGWQLAGIVTLQTGQPFTVLSSVDANLDGNLTDRLNTLAGVREVERGSLRFEFPTTLASQFNLLAVQGADGAVGRNTFRAPGVAVVDLAINKLFRFTERHQLEWRTEIFNLFNRTHFGIPARVLFAPGLGRAVNTTVPARAVQFAVRYKF